jgi:hypothetical protein
MTDDAGCQIAACRSYDARAHGSQQTIQIQAGDHIIIAPAARLADDLNALRQDQQRGARCALI